MMEEEENTDRKKQYAMVLKMLNKIKKSLTEDVTDNVNQVIESNSPELCLSYLTDLEKKGDPRLDSNHLTRLIDSYIKVFSNIPLGEHSENESYAMMLVRFAELKVIQDVSEAEANFSLARSHCHNFAFVHIAHAKFVESQGNTKRGIAILQNAIELGAKPKELLEGALQTMQAAKTQLICSQDKENVPCLANNNVNDSLKKHSELQKLSRMSDIIGSGGSSDDLPCWRSGSQQKRTFGMPVRIPIAPFSISEKNNDDGDIHGKPSNTSDSLVPTNRFRQTSGSNLNPTFGVSSSKKSAKSPDLAHFQPELVSPGQFPREDQASLANNDVNDSLKKHLEFQKLSRMSDGTGDVWLSSVFGSGTELLSGPSDDLPCWRSVSQHKRTFGMPVRIPIAPFSIPEKNNDDGDIHGKPSRTSDSLVPTNQSRQPSGSNLNPTFGVSSSKKSAKSTDLAHFQPESVSPGQFPWEDQAAVDSTTTLLHTRNTSEIEDVTYTFDQIIKSNSPELCWTYLTNLEERGNPQIMNKIKDYCSKVFSRLPMSQYSKNSSYAKILVRYAELKGIEDPDEARDHFIVATSNCKSFAFVHIAYASFEASQGNMIKASSILHKAQSSNAKPAELLELAMRNLKAGKKQLVHSTTEEGHLTDSQTVVAANACNGNQELQLPLRIPVKRSVEQLKPANKESLPEWKKPTILNRYVSPQDKRTTPPEPKLVPPVVDSLPTSSLHHPSRMNSQTICQTPNNSCRNPSANTFITPLVRRAPEVLNSAPDPHRAGPVQQPCTPLNQTNCQTPQASLSALSNETITIKGKQFFILKLIGRGGSSKVYQVLDHKKQLFAVKYVDLEEADAQTIESYKNEIEHLNHLQQYSDQIIKLYEYEITNSYIYMLMECGNLDLNTWLRNRKTVNALERKFYWKNMLEAVHTIHKHGIVHSDLKPANFVIVNASLKLIDFGIANRIQPDVTSIMKDSQVGTLNYMPPEAIKDTSSQPGKANSKISPKGDVWSLGCILYCMTYGKTPFQSITHQITKLHAIIDPSHKIEFPDISEKDLLDVLKRCLVRNPRERISIAELLEHPYLQLKPQASPEPERPSNRDLQKILTDLAALQSPNSIIRAANNLAKMCSSGRKLDVAECAKSSS